MSRSSMPEPLVEPAIPAVHLLHLIELVQRWQVSERELLAGTGLTVAELSDPQRQVPVRDVVLVLERARSLSGEPALGVYLGLSARVTGNGYLGFAAMSASKLHEAIGLAIRYMPIRTTALSLRGHIEGDAAVLTVQEHADFGSARDIVLLALLIGLRQIGSALAGRTLDLVIDLAMPEPAYFARFAHAVPKVRFGRAANQLTGSRFGLDSPLVMADAESLRIASEQCERLLESLGLDGRIAARARAVLLADDGTFRSLEEVAHQLSLSTRTLRRRLAAEQVSFAGLLQEERKARALSMLRSRALSVDEIATRLGYQDLASFTRAFKRWTGETPSAYRRGS